MPDMITAWTSAFTLGLLIAAFFTAARMATRLARLDRKVDVLLQHSGVDLSDVAAREAAALMRAGQKIEAIKVYRELTGAGLAEAKAAVERMG